METQRTGWTKTIKAHHETLRHADKVLADIKAGNISVYAAAENGISRYSLAEAFNIQPSTPDSLVEQTLIAYIPQRIKASLN